MQHGYCMGYVTFDVLTIKNYSYKQTSNLLFCLYSMSVYYVFIYILEYICVGYSCLEGKLLLCDVKRFLIYIYITCYKYIYIYILK